MRLRHLHFGAQDVKQTQAFYETYFGFQEHLNLGDTVVLKDADQFVLAIDALEKVPPASPTLHFGFLLRSAKAVESLYEKMHRAGVSVVQPLKKISDKAIQFYCLDPSGNKVEVGWYQML